MYTKLSKLSTQHWYPFGILLKGDKLEFRFLVLVAKRATREYHHSLELTWHLSEMQKSFAPELQTHLVL